MKNIIGMLLIGCATALAATTPALAGDPLLIPEPSALSLIAATAVAAVIGSRFIRRK